MAGTCVVTLKRGYVDNSLNAKRAFEFDFTADAAAATFPATGTAAQFGDIGAIIDDIGVIFDGTTAPDSLTIIITDGYGAVIYSATALTATQARGLLMQTIPVVNGFTVTLSGNTTNSAKVKIIVYLV